jgi:hypothetical protein
MTTPGGAICTRLAAHLSRGRFRGELRDHYDALVSPRVYRDAWTAGRALDLLRDETGTGFSPECVAALERVLERDAAMEPRGVAAPAALVPLLH